MADLWLAAISHHGVPLTARELESCKEVRWSTPWEPVEGYDPMDAIADLGIHVRTWFPAAWHSASELPGEAAFIHYFAGLVSLADWIASDDRDDFFPYRGHGTACRSAFSRKRAKEVLRRMCLDVEDGREALGIRARSFGEVFREDGTPLEPTDLQLAMEDRGLGQIVIAESETGSGKTEAALWRFKTLFEAGEVDALAFLLPTRVAAVSLERRVRRFFENLFPDLELRPNVVLAVPGYIQSDGQKGIPLARFETLWPDSPKESLAHRRWAAERPKRFLAAAAAVGTIDQALLSCLTIRHAHLRGAALLRALIVVDEVHASDAYMTQLLVGLLRRHTDAGGHALLLSATLGSDARERLLAEPPMPLRPNEKRTPDVVDGAEECPYPALTDRSSIRPIGGRTTEKRVQVTLCPEIDDPGRIAARAAGAVRHGAKVLVVRNTVAGAVDVQDALESELGPAHPALFRARGVPAPHHGRFAAEDRRVLDDAVEQSFGKAAGRIDATVLAGTQTLEQSLDIDADFLITDIAPADVLLQRLGRLHRHEGRQRPSEFATPTVVMLTPPSRDLGTFLAQQVGGNRHGIGSVYENILAIEATWRELEKRSLISIPTDNRILVEAVTRFSALSSLAEELGTNWQSHWREYVGGESAKRGAAETIRLGWWEPWDEQRWSEPGERLRTRLGLDDRLAPFPDRWDSPFDQQIERLKIPGWMAGGADDSDEPARVTEHTPAGLRFRWADRSFIYTRRGLARDMDSDVRA